MCLWGITAIVGVILTAIDCVFRQRCVCGHACFAQSLGKSCALFHCQGGRFGTECAQGDTRDGRCEAGYTALADGIFGRCPDLCQTPLLRIGKCAFDQALERGWVGGLNGECFLVGQDVDVGLLLFCPGAGQGDVCKVGLAIDGSVGYFHSFLLFDSVSVG